MHLTRLEVTNWRGLPTQVLDFDQDITVVGGPNESGKSSLRSALRAVLLLPTGARGEKKVIEANRPWDTKLYPKVKLDLVIDDKPCTVEKEFLRAKQWASLHYDGRLIAQDDDVQGKLMELLGPASEWIDVLWGVQGEVVLDRSAPDSIKGRLASAAQDTVMPQVAELQRLVSEAYTDFWTEKRGSPTKKLQVVRDATMNAEKLVHELEEKISAANKSADDLDSSARQLESLSAGHAKLQEQWQTGQESLGAWETYARALGEAEAANVASKTLEQWLDSWTQTLERICKLVPESRTWQNAVDQLKEKLGAAPSRTEVEELIARQKYLELSMARDRYAEAEAMLVPPAAELKSLKEQDEVLREIDARLKMGEFRAKLTSEASLLVTLTRDGGAPEIRSVPTAGTEEWTAEQSFDLVLPGVAKLQVESGNPSIANDISRRADLQSELDEALTKWGATSVGDLQNRATERDTKLRQLRKPESRQLASARSVITDADEVDDLSLEEREDLLGEIPSELAVAELTWNKAQSQYQQNMSEYQALTARNPVTELKTVLEGMQAHWRSAPFERQAEVSVPEGEISDSWLNDLDSHKVVATNLLKDKKEDATRLQQSVIRPDGEEVTKDRLQQWQAQMQAAASQVQSLTATVNQTIGTISAQGDLYSQLVLARESQARTQTEEKKLELDAMAVRELQQSFDAARQQLQKDVVAPLQERVSERFSALTAGFYSGVGFDPSLKLSGIITPSFSGVALEDLSFGTREQLSLLTRLCLAELLSASSGRQTVILDDNLVHTDNSRMAVACRLMEEASETVQIIVFTCHPERYSEFTAPREVLIKGR